MVWRLGIMPFLCVEMIIILRLRLYPLKYLSIPFRLSSLAWNCYLKSHLAFRWERNNGKLTTAVCL